MQNSHGPRAWWVCSSLRFCAAVVNRFSLRCPCVGRHGKPQKFAFGVELGAVDGLGWCVGDARDAAAADAKQAGCALVQGLDKPRQVGFHQQGHFHQHAGLLERQAAGQGGRRGRAWRQGVGESVEPGIPIGEVNRLDPGEAVFLADKSSCNQRAVGIEMPGLWGQTRFLLKETVYALFHFQFTRFA